jgi:hypothetical protein
MQIVGGMIVFSGLMIMAGSAGDCDGQCMELANSTGEMIQALVMGGALTAIGAFLMSMKGNL